MEENYIFGLIVFFFFGLVLFKKEKNVSVDNQQTDYSSNTRASGVSGVSKYLENQQKSEITGVAKYLQEKQELIDDSPVLSGVAKYLADKDEVPVSSVSKYMARQSVQAKKMAKENVSGVEKYLNNRK